MDDLAHFSTFIIDNTKLYTFLSGGDETDNNNGIHDDNHYDGINEKDDKDFKIPIFYGSKDPQILKISKLVDSKNIGILKSWRFDVRIPQF